MKIQSRLTLLNSLGIFGLATLVLAADHPVASVNPDAALAKLKEGNTRFATNRISTGKPTAARRADELRVGCARKLTPDPEDGFRIR